MGLRRREDAPRGVVVGPDRGIVEPIRLERLFPPADLAHVVEHVWIVHWDVRATGPRTTVTLPHPAVHWVVEGESNEVVGVHPGRFVRRLEGKGRVVGVRFRTGAFTAFTDVSMATLAGRRFSAAQFLPGAEGLAERLAGESDDEAARLVLDVVRAHARPLSPRAKRVHRIVERITSDRELVSVEGVGVAFGMRPLALQRLFRETLGVSPKWVIQRARVHEAVERIADDARRGVKTSHAALALELGFTDQAHFTRTFGTFVGSSPRAYARALQEAKSTREAKSKREAKSESKSQKKSEAKKSEEAKRKRKPR